MVIKGNFAETRKTSAMGTLNCKSTVFCIHAVIKLCPTTGTGKMSFRYFSMLIGIGFLTAANDVQLKIAISNSWKPDSTYNVSRNFAISFYNKIREPILHPCMTLPHSGRNKCLRTEKRKMGATELRKVILVSP